MLIIAQPYMIMYLQNRSTSGLTSLACSVQTPDAELTSSLSTTTCPLLEVDDLGDLRFAEDPAGLTFCCSCWFFLALFEVVSSAGGLLSLVDVLCGEADFTGVCVFFCGSLSTFSCVCATKSGSALAVLCFVATCDTIGAVLVGVACVT